jgi:hypothetical protein
MLLVDTNISVDVLEDDPQWVIKSKVADGACLWPSQFAEENPIFKPRPVNAEQIPLPCAPPVF